MSLIVPGGNKKYIQRPRNGPLKVAIVGTSPISMKYAPWEDFSYEIAAHSSAGQIIPRCDLFIDQHYEWCFKEERKNGFANYYQWLKDLRIPVLMQKHYKEIPASVAFPRQQFKARWPDVEVGSQAAMLIGYYLMQGVSVIGLYGVEYSHSELEREQQRESTREWIGIARGMGVKIERPPSSSICGKVGNDYAWNTHDTPEKYAALKKSFADQAAKGRGKMPATMAIYTDAEREAAKARAMAHDPKLAEEINRWEDSDPEIPRAILENELDFYRTEYARLRTNEEAQQMAMRYLEQRNATEPQPEATVTVTVSDEPQVIPFPTAPPQPQEQP